MSRKKKTNSQIISFFLMVLLCSFFYMFNNIAIISSWSIIAVSFLLLIVDLSRKKDFKKKYLSQYFVFVFLFIVYILLNAFWAADSQSTVEKGLSLVKIMVCMLIIFYCYSDRNSIDELLKAVMWSGPVVALYTIIQYGYAGIQKMVTDAKRLDTDFANINGIGIWMAFSIILFVYFIIKDRFHFSYIFMVLPVFILALSQSRIAWIASIFGVFLLILFYSFENKNFFRGFTKFLLLLLVLTVIILVISQLSVFDGIKVRMDSLLISLGLKNGITYEESTMQRFSYIKAGLRQFLRTPIGGIGIGNSYIITVNTTGHKTYLHNNYVELLACGGIIAFCLYYFIYFRLITGLRKQVKKRQPYADICIILLLVTLLVDLGTVSYYSKVTWLLLTIGALQFYSVGKSRKKMII